MARLRIVASGETESGRSQARGKLFEKIVAEVMRRHGYEIDEYRTNVTHAGMEIDIEGKTTMTGIPVYCECKCYSSDIGVEKLQTFYGKYMTQWFKNNKAQGLFIALPGINSHAMGFYKENCEANDQITVRLLQEPDVLDALVKSKLVISDNEIAMKVENTAGIPGDSVLICSDKGFFWLQYIVPIGSGLASKIQIFDSLGHPITDQPTIDYLAALVSEVKEFEMVLVQQEIERSSAKQREDIDEIVELRGSSSCFEYQFPASPEYFIGRNSLLDSIDKYIIEIINNNTSSRGILFEANSGWGKSSLVLTTIARAKKNGHYAVAIDSRSASSSQFIMKAVQYILTKFESFNGYLSKQLIVTGFDGAVQSLIEVDKTLKSQGKLLFIFFDQFENIFYLHDVLTKITQLCLKISDNCSNIILGFSWKTDLVGLTREFPYRWRDIIIDSCRVFHLKQFSEIETQELLNQLEEELPTKLRKDLQFLLSEFSQGYPWLLKKLCAHVKNQCSAGIPQADIARGLLNVEQLFMQDIQGLSAEEEEVLRRIARIAPVSIADLGEEFSPDIVQPLVNRRLIVKVGIKYDIYWDIFRDYLNTGKLPIQEVYLLRSQVVTILKAINILSKSGGALDISSFKVQAGLSDGTFLNVARDLRLLNLAHVKDDKLVLVMSIPEPTEKGVINYLRTHLNERLPRNRCFHAILKILREKSQIDLNELAGALRQEFPYISAVQKTWQTYAKNLAAWLDIADLAILDETKTLLSEYKVGSQIRERSLPFAPKRTGVTVPSIHFAPIVQVASRLISALQNNTAVDWSGISKSTIYKSLSVLEEMKLISRRSTSIRVAPECNAFVNDLNKRVKIASECVLKWPIFKDFVNIIIDNKFTRLSHSHLGKILQKRNHLHWKEGTAEVNVKIMMDWARHLNLVPGEMKYSSRGRFKGANIMPLFETPRLN